METPKPLPFDLKSYGEDRLTSHPADLLRAECQLRRIPLPNPQAQRATCVKLLLEWKHKSSAAGAAKPLPFDLKSYGEFRLMNHDADLLRAECQLRRIDIKPQAQRATCVEKLEEWKQGHETGGATRKRAAAPATGPQKKSQTLPPTVAMPPKKRPKLVAFKSTGGYAPRKQLAAKVARQGGWEAVLARLPGAREREARAAANNEKQNKPKKPKEGEREIYALKIARSYGTDDEQITTMGLYASWDRCCEAAHNFIQDKYPDVFDSDYDNNSDEEEEVIDVICHEQAAGPPLEVGDKIRFVDATKGEEYERSRREMRVFAETHSLYEEAAYGAAPRKF